jgi:tight adherence protein B
MRSRPFAALLVGALASVAVAVPALWPAAAGAQADGVHIREVDLDAFPSVTITASIVGDGAADDVVVKEAGRRVSGATVTPLDEGAGPVDVVLVVDTSNSMAGAPMAAAIAAALEFVTNLPPDGVRVGIVSFDRVPTIVQPITEDHTAVLTALGDLRPRQGTALYDAVVQASGLFEGAGQRNLIVLSDGADMSSAATLDGAIAAADAAGAAIFAVGLESPGFDVRPLQALAEGTGGVYAPAGAADLSTVYAGLAQALTNQYRITYTSASKGGGQVEVAVSGPAGSDSALVLFPEVRPPAAREQAPTDPGRPLLAGSWGLAVTIGLFFAAAFVLLTMALGARQRSRRDQDLVRRVAVAQEPDQEPDDAERERAIAGWIPEAVVAGAERVAQVGGFGGRVEHKLERAGLPLRTGEFVAIVGGVGVLGALLAVVLLGNPLFALIIAVAAATIPMVLLSRAVSKRNKKLHGQLADILMILASSLRAGHSFFQALDMVAKEIGEPGATEFGRVVAEIRLGRPVDEAMNAMAERVGSDDFRWAVLGVNIQREVGGNLAEVLDTVADTVRERDQIRRQVDVLSAEGKLSIGILASLPFFVALYIAKVNPGYLNLLFSTRVGLIMVVTAGCLMAIGVAWMRKIVSIDV